MDVLIIASPVYNFKGIRSVLEKSLTTVCHRYVQTEVVLIYSLDMRPEVPRTFYSEEILARDWLRSLE